jgi:uncharacterized membrane protein YgcG
MQNLAEYTSNQERARASVWGRGEPMKSPRLALISAFLLSIILAALPVWAAESHVRIVRLSLQQGKVEVDRNAGQGFEKAIENMPIVEGSKLRTGDNGQAEVEMEDGTVARLAPDSEIGFPRLALDSGNKLTTIAVEKGTAYFDVRHKGHDLISISLPGRQIDLDHSAHFRVFIGSDRVRLSVYSGEVSFTDNGKNVVVKKNETVALDTNDQKYQTAKGIDSMAGDSWDHDRTQYQQAYSSTAVGVSSGLSPYYGWSDLNYYGGWYMVPGYGMMWQPYNTYAGWSPYGSGAWAYYPGPGYLWVSSYPWGWLPYRYGAWQFIPGWGWAWQPGTVWNAWYPAPVIINPPVAFVIPRAPVVVAGTQVAPTVIVRNDPALASNSAITTRRMSALPKGTTVISTPGILNPAGPDPYRGFSPNPGAPHNVPSPHVPKGAQHPEPRAAGESHGGFMARMGSGFGRMGSGISSFAHGGGGGGGSGGGAGGHGR